MYGIQTPEYIQNFEVALHKTTMMMKWVPSHIQEHLEDLFPQKRDVSCEIDHHFYVVTVKTNGNLYILKFHKNGRLLKKLVSVEPKSLPDAIKKNVFLDLTGYHLTNLMWDEINLNFSAMISKDSTFINVEFDKEGNILGIESI